ncbi:hypothetical protein OROMI_033070 [Orobanche minor]
MAIAITRLFPSLLLLLAAPSSGFQSDELLVDDEFSLEAGRLPDPPPVTRPVTSARSGFGFGSGLEDPIPARARLRGLRFLPLRNLHCSPEDVAEWCPDRLIEGDDFYQIRLPSNLVSQPGREYIISSVKARCLSQRDALDEHFVINMDGVNVLGVNYGPPGSCQYPRVFRPQTPVFTEAVLGENGEGEELKPPERSFWAKYWMYLIALGSFS